MPESTNRSSSLLNPEWTYRVQGIPREYESRSQVQSLLTSVLSLDGIQHVRVRSLAVSPNRKTLMATVNFKIQPDCLSSDRSNKKQWSFKIPTIDDDTIPTANTIKIDSHFRGITVFRSFEDNLEHKIDCIAISGLGGHAFGSFKERAGSHMWLCDSLPSDLLGARIMTYGYDTQVHGSHTFEDLEALASNLRVELQALVMQDLHNASPEYKPLIFIAHGLGGLVVKEAIVQMKRDKNHRQLLGSIYGALFFGVPNQGMEIASLIPMVSGQPNQSLLLSLGKESKILRDQCREFPKAFDYKDSEIFCFYETEMSPTAALHGTEWKMTGPLSILVDSSSARHGRPWENEPHHCLALKRSNSDMVKFSSIDEDYGRVRYILTRMASAAIRAIPRGMSYTEVERLNLVRRWLSSPDQSIDHERARGLCKPNSGLCLINGPSFLLWKTSQKPFLWLHGIPGCGKPLSSTIIQKLIDEFQGDPKVAVVYFYFDFNDKDKQKPGNLLSSLLVQLASQKRRWVSKTLDDLYTHAKVDTSGQKLPPTFDEMYATFVSLVVEFDQVYLCLDALDECTDRMRLMDLLKRIQKQNLAHLHILATSRNERDVEVPLTKVASTIIDLRNPEADTDLQRYIEIELGKDWRYTAPSAEVQKDITQALMQKAKGT